MAAVIGVAILVVLVGVLVLRGSSFRIYRALGEAMAPTINQGDRFLIDRSAFRGGILPERGDIVVFGDPGRMEEDLDACAGPTFVQRVIGLPGETVEVRRGGGVLIDGSSLPEAYLGRGEDRTDFGPDRIPEDAVFVLGDNRAVSRDSRALGPIPASALCGKVLGFDGT